MRLVLSTANLLLMTEPCSRHYPLKRERGVEIYGLVIFTSVAAMVSLAVACLVMFFRNMRRFALAALITPPAAVFALILCRWAVLDSGPVCGPDPEWNRCPSTTASVTGWVVWIVGSIAIAAGAFLLQRVLEAAMNLLFDSEPMTLFNRNKI